MKVFKDGVMYVEFYDLFYLRSVPKEAIDEIRFFYHNNERVVKFTNPVAIEFFKNQEQIMYYEFLNQLSLTDIDNMISNLEDEIKIYNMISDNKYVFLNNEFDTRRAMLNRKLLNLKLYKENKDEYDQFLINYFANNNVLIKRKR